MSDENERINWPAVKDVYPEQYNLDPMEWRFRTYGFIRSHDDACYLDFLARNSRALLDAAARLADAEQELARLREALGIAADHFDDLSTTLIRIRPDKAVEVSEWSKEARAALAPAGGGAEKT